MADMKPARAPVPTETPTDAVERRIAELQNWLQETAPECFEEQTHLDEGTRERVYWHYGYLMALRDVMDSWHSLAYARSAVLKKPYSKCD